MKTVTLQYYTVFGKWDQSDPTDWEYELNDEEAAVYDKTLEAGGDLESVPLLQNVLSTAASEIEEEQLKILIETEDEFTMECMGLARVDPNEINDLVAARDEHALSFFGLDGLEDDALDSWDATELDEEDLPQIKDFYEDFNPTSPYDGGWILEVHFAENI